MVIHVDGNEQLADVLNKLLTEGRFQKLCSNIMRH